MCVNALLTTTTVAVTVTVMSKGVIPTAYEDLFPPSPRWRLELYLTPSHLVFSTAGVLCGLSIGIAMLIALLHAREKVCKECRHLILWNSILSLNCTVPRLQREAAGKAPISLQCHVTTHQQSHDLMWQSGSNCGASFVHLESSCDNLAIVMWPTGSNYASTFYYSS